MPPGFFQVSPEGAGDEDSCSSSAPLSPSSSPRSMASGSVCPPGKCVCNSCGLEIVDKYLLKVGGAVRPKGSGNSGKREKFSPSFQFQVLVQVVGFLSKAAQSRASRKSGRRNPRLFHIAAKQLVHMTRRALEVPVRRAGCTSVSHRLVGEQKWVILLFTFETGSCLIIFTETGLSLHPQQHPYTCLLLRVSG